MYDLLETETMKLDAMYARIVAATNVDIRAMAYGDIFAIRPGGVVWTEIK